MALHIADDLKVVHSVNFYIKVHCLLHQLHAVLINTNIKEASLTCFSTSVLSSGRTKCQF